MTKSLYAQYIAEREGKETYEGEDYFATVKFFPDGKTCYVADVFVLPESRGSGRSREILTAIERDARKRGYTRFLSTVDSDDKNAERSRHILGTQGMKRDGWFAVEVEVFAKELE